jgi:hypothetical protein
MVEPMPVILADAYRGCSEAQSSACILQAHCANGAQLAFLALNIDLLLEPC